MAIKLPRNLNIETVPPKREKKNDYYDDEIVIDPEDLLNALSTALKEDNKKDFFDIINLAGYTQREIYLAGEIGCGTGATIEGVIRFWNEIDEKNNIPVEERKPIKLYINTNGGDLLESFIMVDAIKMSKTPVWTIAQGMVYSGGFFTYICGHKRFAYPHSSFLYHEGSAGNSGTAAQFENFTAFYKKQLKQLKDVVIEHTHISEEEYSDIKKDDVWYTADEAIEKGIVDEIIESFI